MIQGDVSPQAGGLVKGFWQYLLARLLVRAELEKERERNRAYADHRDRLPDNSELVDSETCQGRFLRIRRGAQTCAASTQFREAAVLAAGASPAGIGAGWPQPHADVR